MMLPLFDEIPEVSQDEIDKGIPYRFLYCIMDGKLYYYHRKFEGDYTRHSAIEHGTSRKKPHKFKQMAKARRILDAISEFSELHGYKWQIGYLRDYDEIVKAVAYDTV